MVTQKSHSNDPTLPVLPPPGISKKLWQTAYDDLDDMVAYNHSNAHKHASMFESTAESIVSVSHSPNLSF